MMDTFYMMNLKEDLNVSDVQNFKFGMIIIIASFIKRMFKYNVEIA